MYPESSTRRSSAATIASAFGILAVLVTLSGLSGCGTEVVKYESLHLKIKSDAPTSGSVTFLDISILSPPGDDGQSALKYPPADGSLDELFKFPLPTDADITGAGYTIEFKQPAGSAGPHLIRILGQDDSKKILTSFSGVIDTSLVKLHEILLRAPDLNCDADGDGAKDCTKDGCCGAGEIGDCNDNAPNASPFSFENSCTQCGNQIDEDCDGKDTPCIDTDNDGVADCIEDQTCGGDAKNDKSVFPPREDDKVAPGATELCDGKDNDCDKKIDEDLTYIGVDGTKGNKLKGEACGSGACAGGTVVCGKDPTQLMCSSADKKAVEEDCTNDVDDDCNGKVNDGCELQDIDGDGVNSDDEDKACANPFAKFHPEFGTSQTHKAYETSHCCLAWTKAILAKDSGWKKTKDADFGVPADVSATKDLLSLCDFDCNGKIEPCAHDDKDGDGVPAGLDCKDEDPTVFPAFSGQPAAAEQCGDGVDQDCIGGDEACSDDKDGDKYNAKQDCNDDDKTVHPNAKELCNGKDDDCNGLIDDGNAEAADKECGDKDGVCGEVPGVTVCKHWPAEQEPSDLDCLTKAMDATSRTCVGCEGDKRPDPEICDYKDNDCDGEPDEDFTYDKQGGKKLKVGASCDGVGECGAGTVECHIGLKHATCSTDPDGSKKQNKVEVCDNKDNNCNGQTDETLSAIADASCRKSGVCGGLAIQKLATVCKSGKWVCDYSKVADIEFDKDLKCVAGDASCHCPNLGDTCYKLNEATCDGKDNDCSGQTDEDFEYVDTAVGGKKSTLTYGTGATVCGTGACDKGKIVCSSNKKGVTCSTIGKTTGEICDFIDNDCDGLTDDGLTVSDSNCKLKGVCNSTNVKAECKTGKWVCDYSAIKDHEGPTTNSCSFTDTVCIFNGSKEKSCDAKDNDCDGKTDEDFTYTNIGDGAKATKLGKDAVCGTGECKEGKVICNAAGDDLTCSTIDKKSKDVCDYKDNDCDGLSDEDYTYVEHGSASSLKVGATCDGIGTCGKGQVECLASKDAVTCSTDPNGSKPGISKEICDDNDNDCNKIVDEGCDDDGDKYCDSAMQVVGKPKACPNGGGDCKDKDANFNPGVAELCDGTDNDCNGQTDEVFFWTIPYDKDAGKSGKLGIGKTCGLGACSGGTITCNGDKKGVHCTTFSPGTSAKNKPETICDDIDNDCDGLTDEGCDSDGDKYCDDNMTTVGKPKACPLGAGDCNDDPNKGGKDVFPGHAELCNDIDDNCAGGVDEACDKDNDGYCDKAKVTVGKPKVCPKGGNDCNDDPNKGGKEIHPGHVEWCDDVDQDCDNNTDEGCDDDGDGYCDVLLNYAYTGSSAPKACPKGKGDCDDALKSFHPTAVEVCDNKDQDCDKTVDEGCNDDGDGFCDKNMAVVGAPNVCAQGGGDCNDKDKKIHPAAQEICNGKDDDCDQKTDAADPDLGKARPDCNIQKGVCKGSKKPVDLCVNGSWKDCTATHYGQYSTKYKSNPVESLCDDLDNDCDGSVDIGCDVDGDGYCTSTRTTVGKPKVCPKGGGDCNDANSATGKSVNPGAQENCATPWDDNCNDTTNDVNAKGCIKYYRDLDKDGYGSTASAQPQCRCEKSGDWSALQNGDCDDFSKGKSSYSWTDAKGNERSVGSTCGLGACVGGTVQCDSKTATCSTYFGSGNKKSGEVCDGKDNDCDGKTDENATLKLKSCSNLGVCKDQGVTPECSNGKEICDYASNVNGYSKVDDSCNNKDNDCDGKTDENADVSAFPCPTKGVCSGANITAKCVAGQPKCDFSGLTTYQATEDKCDNKDNDCDGTTDENVDASGLSCSNAGVCKNQTPVKKCSNGNLTCDFTHVTAYQKSETKCDNKDNDCDGTVDELSDMSKPNDCVEGVCTADKVKGLCSKGKWTCDYSGVSLYAEETKTAVGICTDNKDNDCDGAKDSADTGCQ